MKLYYSVTSPFVRKCLVSAVELNLRDRLELLPAAPHPVTRDRILVGHNPLGQLPTLITDDAQVLYDSRVICEYLNALGDGNLLPPHGAARWAVLVDQTLADGVMAAAVLTRYETAARPEPLRWREWIDGQMDKVTSGLEDIERRAPQFADRVDLGTITIACALEYLDFRYAALAWRDRHPNTAAWLDRFSRRPSMQTTQPTG